MSSKMFYTVFYSQNSGEILREKERDSKMIQNVINMAKSQEVTHKINYSSVINSIYEPAEQESVLILALDLWFWMRFVT